MEKDAAPGSIALVGRLEEPRKGFFPLPRIGGIRAREFVKGAVSLWIGRGEPAGQGGELIPTETLAPWAFPESPGQGGAEGIKLLVRPLSGIEVLEGFEQESEVEGCGGGDEADESRGLARRLLTDCESAEGPGGLSLHFRSRFGITQQPLRHRELLVGETASVSCDALESGGPDERVFPGFDRHGFHCLLEARVGIRVDDETDGFAAEFARGTLEKGAHRRGGVRGKLFEVAQAGQEEVPGGFAGGLVGEKAGEHAVKLFVGREAHHDLLRQLSRGRILLLIAKKFTEEQED